MPKITDDNAIALICEAEMWEGMGDHDSQHWRDEYNRYRQQLEEQRPALLIQLREWRAAREVDNDPEDDWDSPQRATGIVIYGVTGSTRWFVRGDGSICFSKYHCPPDTALSIRQHAWVRRLGFNID
jgi:hypothetical protein